MVEFKEIHSKTILTPANGILTGSAFTFTLNPYIGCAFGCKYCYVKEFPQTKFREQEWGEYVDIKTNASELLEKEIKKAKKKGKRVSIFMSTATDPYQGIEVKTGLTRSLLKSMLSVIDDIDYLMIHTRSPLAKRDIELFKKFGDKIIISMSIETDLEKIRKSFTPSAPPIPARLSTLKKITEAGVPTRASISPMLPFSKNFPKILKKSTNQLALDTFFMGDGTRGKRTEKMGIKRIYEEMNLLNWYKQDAYKKVLPLLQEEFPEIDLFNES